MTNTNSKGMTGAPSAHSLRAAALRYAANGWPVFLLGRSKRPIANCPQCTQADRSHDPQACQCLLCHGFYAATLEVKRITAMFTNVPTPMLAIRTGYVSRLVVVDVDPAHGGLESLSSLVSRGMAPPTAYVRTGSGGLHLFYRHPGGKIPSSQGRLAPGIDIRADGGYVAAAPSTHPRTRQPYRWIDERKPVEMAPALLQACMPAFPATGATSVISLNPTVGGGAISAPDRLMDTLLDRIRQAPQGRRRVTLYGCARGVARIVTAGHLSVSDAYRQLTDACDRAGWPQAKSTPRAIADGFADEGVTL